MNTEIVRILAREATRANIARVLGLNPDGPLGFRITERVLFRLETGHR